MPKLLFNVISALSKVADSIAITANVVGTLMVLALVAIVNYDVFMRGVFNAPFMGTVEVVQFSLVMVVFLQLPDVVRVNRLTRSDGFLLVMGDRKPWVAAAIRKIVDAISSMFMLVIAIAVWPEFHEMWLSNDFFGVPGVFTAPWWPIHLIIFLSACLCSIMFALKLTPQHLSETGCVPSEGKEGAA